MLKKLSLRHNYSVLLILSFTIVVFLAGLAEVWSGRVSPIWDADQQFAPYFSIVADFAKAGRLLFWSPWTDGGAPVFIETQMGTLSPLTVGLGLISPAAEVGYRFYWLSIWCLGLIGMFCLVRNLSKSDWVSVVVSLGYAFSGPFLSNAEHMSWVYAYALLPWTTHLITKAILEKKTHLAWTAGMIWGLSGLGGYPGHLVATGCFIGLYTLFGILCFLPNEPVLPYFRRSFILLAAFLVSGIIVASPSYFGFMYEGAGYTDRSSSLSKERVISENALHPGTIITLLSPYLGSLKMWNKMWDYNDISSLNSYIGIVPLWGVLLGLFRFRWKKAQLLAVSLIFFIIAASLSFPVRGWLYDILPPFRFFRHSSLFRFYFCFSLLMYAGLSLQSYVSTGTNKKKMAPILILFLIVIACASIKFSGLTFDNRSTLALSFPVLASGLLVAGLFSKTNGCKSFAAPAFVLCAVLDVFNVKQNGFDVTFVRDPGARKFWDDFNSQHVSKVNFSNQWQRTPGSGGDNKNLVDKKFELYNYSTLQNELHTAQRSVIPIQDLATGNLTLWFASNAINWPHDHDSFTKYQEVLKTEQKPLLFVHSLESLVQKRDQPSQSTAVTPTDLARAVLIPLKIDQQELKPTLRTTTIEVPDDGWIFVPERWARGWKVFVNGVETEFLPANFSFRAFKVTKGETSIVQIYEPKYIWMLLSFSWSNIFGSLLYCFWHRKQECLAPGMPA